MESEIIKEPIKKKDVNKKKGPKILVIVVAIIFILVVLFGIYLRFIGNPKRIVSSAIDNLSEKITSTTNMNNATNIGDNYTTSGDIKLNVESDYLSLLASYNDSYAPYINMLNNIGKTTNKFSIVQNKDEKKLLATIDSKLNNEDLISAKYYIEDNKQYYYITGVLDSYINNGESNYFESLDSNHTSKENMNYIYNFVIKSFKDNLKDEYFTKSKDTININGKEESVSKISVKITNKVIKEISTNMLNDLKKDKRANNILTSINEDFKEAKISDSEDLLSDDEELEFNIYTNSITYKIRKYELVIKEDNKNYSVNYYENDSNGNIEILEGKNIIYTAVIKKNKNKTDINITDKDKKQVGTINITKEDDTLNIVSNIKVEEYDISLKMSNKIDEKEKNKDYDITSSVECTITMSNSVFANISVEIDANMNNKADIKEDTLNSVDSSAYSSELQNKLTEVLLKLMS